MVSQTGLNGGNATNGGPHRDLPLGIVGHISEFFSDTLTLAELQLQLFVADGKEGLAKVLLPVITIAAGVVVLLFCLPLAMAASVVALAEAGGFSWVAATFLALGLWLALGGAVALGGLMWLKSRWQWFERSLAELQANIAWAKSVLSRFSGREPKSRVGERV
jgi:hypothetical protein